MVQEETPSNNHRLSRFLGIAVLLAGYTVLVVALAKQSFPSQPKPGGKPETGALAYRALDEIRADPELALLLALRAGGTQPGNPALDALHRTLTTSAVRLRLVDGSGKDAPLTACVWTPDGQRIFTGGTDGKVRIWDTAHGRFLGFAEAPGEPASAPLECLAISADGTLLAAAAEDGMVQVRAIPKGDPAAWPKARVLKHLARGEDKPTGVSCVAFDGAGRRIITACHDGTARVWDLRASREILRLAGHTGEVRSAAFSPAHNLAATAGLDGTARLWDLDARVEPGSNGAGSIPLQQTPLATLRVETEGDRALWDAQFSPDGLRLITAGGDHTARIWDLPNGVELLRLGDHVASVLQARFIDANRVVTVSADKTARIWQLADTEQTGFPSLVPANTRIPFPVRTKNLTATCVSILRGHADSLRAVAVNPDHESIVTASRDGTARIWTLARGVEASAFDTGAPIWDAAFSPDGSHLVVAAAATPLILDAKSGSDGSGGMRLIGHQGIVHHVCYSPDGKKLATVDSFGAAKIWDTQTGHELSTLKGHFYSLAFDPSGEFLAGASDENAAIICELSDGSSVALKHDDRVLAVAFSPDGTRFVTTSLDRQIRIWDRKTRREIRRLVIESRAVPLDVEFSADGKLIASAWGDGRVVLWNADSFARVAEFNAHEGEVEHARFFARKAGADPKAHPPLTLVTTGADGRVRVWGEDAATHRWSGAYELPGAEGAVYALACSPDGTQVFAGGADQTARFYATAPNSLLSLAASRVTRKLSDEELRDFGLSPAAK